MNVVRGARVEEEGTQGTRGPGWAALRAHANRAGEVSGTGAELREWLGAAAEEADAHLALIRLNQDDRFRGTPMFEDPDEGFSFSVTLRQ